MDTAVVWFRRDLRVHDNEALTAACDADAVVPVYCFDPRSYGTREFGGRHSFTYQKTGARRAAFYREAVADLGERLRRLDLDLWIRHAPPADALAEVVEAVDADSVHFQTLPLPEERAQANRVTEAATSVGATPERHWTHTLHHVDDLPRPVAEIDDTFTPFRKRVERASRVRDPLPEPDPPGTPADSPRRGEVPSMTALGFEGIPTYDERGVLAFAGGETVGKERVAEYVWEADRLREYKRTRNGLLGEGYSSKFSPWLNAGCLSPRYVQSEVDRYEDERVSNQSTYWLTFELRWRDFFQFQFAKHGGDFFTPGGIRNRQIDWRDDPAQFHRWCEGRTGIPFVDANVRELNETGYMSNRGRQNVASFLANNLRIDWRKGAAYFETRLVDYDPASNYGNWAYNSQVGNDSRDSYFDVVGQAKRYDENAEYVKTWCPELSDLPADYAHEPWTMNDGLQEAYGVVLGDDYPEPMIGLEASYEKLRS